MRSYIFSWMFVCFCCVCFSFSVLSQEIGCEERLWNDLFCVGWMMNLNWGLSSSQPQSDHPQCFIHLSVVERGLQRYWKDDWLITSECLACDWSLKMMTVDWCCDWLQQQQQPWLVSCSRADDETQATDCDTQLAGTTMSVERVRVRQSTFVALVDSEAHLIDYSWRGCVHSHFRKSDNMSEMVQYRHGCKGRPTKRK